MRASKYTGRYGNSGEKKNGAQETSNQESGDRSALKGFLLGLSNTRGAQKTQNAHLEEQNRGESKIGSSWRGVNTSTATVTTNTKSGPSSMGASSVRALKRRMHLVLFTVLENKSNFFSTRIEIELLMLSEILSIFSISSSSKF